MNLRRICFPYLSPPIKIDVWPADLESNAVYRAACIAWLKPLELAARVGRVDEEAGRTRLAWVYAEGVIQGSPSPQCDGWGRDEWRQWLLDHPEEFDRLRGICEVTTNFEDVPDDAPPRPTAAGA